VTHAVLDSLWDFADLAASEARLRGAAEAGGEMGLAAQTQVARALGLQGKFDECLALLDEILPRCKDPTSRCRWELEAGRRLNSMRQPDRAIPHFEAAWQQSDASEFYRIDALHMLAIASETPEKRIAWAEQGLETARSATDSRAQAWQGSLWNNLGWERFEQGRLEEAKDAFEAQIEARIAFGQADRLIPARWALARCMREMGQIRHALAIQEELSRQDPSDAYVAEELAILRGGEPID
jgi:tetratricopeptide (TPR) repeat protein